MAKKDPLSLSVQKKSKKKLPPLSQQLYDQLSKDNACYVLITCGNPTDGGQMHVEMTYEGDVALASYLLQGAQSIIDEQEESKASST